MKLTEEGRALYARTGMLLADLHETASTIASGGHRPRGRLRISASLRFSQTATGHLAAGFALKRSQVRWDVTTEDRPVDMVEEADDLVIPVSPEPDESLVARIVQRDRLVLVGHPEMKKGCPSRPWGAERRGRARPGP